MIKKRVDILVLNSNETITLDSPEIQNGLGIVDNGGVAIDKGKIVLAASTDLLVRKFRAGRTINAEDEIILPGLVDPHTHLVFAGARDAEFQLRIAGVSYMEILRKGGGIIETVNRTRQASQESLFQFGKQRLDTCLESGSTTVEIKSGYGLRLDDELRILRKAAKLGLKPKIHADQFTSCGGAEVANKLHATSADHLIHSSAKQFEQMTKTGVTPVLLPSSSHSLLAAENADARGMLGMGLPVALGTDFSPSNWMLGQLTVAALASRALRMNASEIIRGITINAARALGLEKRVGSLHRGKQADLVTLRAPNHRWVGYAYGERVVDNVLIEGEPVVKDGKRIP